jgi:uncharacterized phage protein (TIGR02218 family)
MRAIDPELQATLDGGATRLCRCWRIERRDGTVHGFTDHDRDLSFDGVVHRASSGMDASALTSSTGLSVDNAQAVGALSDAAITEEDIRAGRFDRAEIRHWLVDWSRPEVRVLMFRGHLGEIRRADGRFEVELRGLAEALNVPVGRSILRTCDRALGDAKCGFDTGQPGFSAEAEASAGSSADRIAASGLDGFAAGWFTHGTLVWLTGANAGGSTVVKSDLPSGTGKRLFELWQQPAFPVAVGDHFRVTAGCDKRAETCRQKFNNFLNFRGFPHIPGEDWVTAYPKSGAVHDGASQHGQ